MKTSEMIIGKYYHFKGSTGYWTLKYTDNKSRQIYGACVSATSFYSESCWGPESSIQESTLREATEQEQLHLEACMAARKYVPLPEVNIIQEFFIFN